MLSKDPVKAHLPSTVRATEDIKPYALKEHEDYYQDLKDPRVVRVVSKDPVKAHLPSGVRATDDYPACMP